MGYHEVDRIGEISILDHSFPAVAPFPIAIDCAYPTLPLDDIEAQLEDAGIDVTIFLSHLDALV